jgi:O-antigen ligase
MLSFNLGVLVTAILYILNIGVSFDGERLKIFGENANKIGILSVIAVMYIFSIILEKKKHSKIKYLLGLALIPLVNMLASTGSRITFAGLTLGLFIYFFVRNIKFSDIYLRLLTFLPIYFLIQYILSFSVLRNRLFNSIEEGDLSGRDTLWSNLWPYLIENPFMGVGINGYIEISTILYGTYFSPHNVFLEIFAYTGLIGLFLFLLFFYRIFQMTLVIKKRNNLLFPLVLVMLIFMVFFSGQGLTTKPFWLIYLYVVGTYLNSSHEIQENRNFIE